MGMFVWCTKIPRKTLTWPLLIENAGNLKKQIILNNKAGFIKLV